MALGVEGVLNCVHADLALAVAVQALEEFVDCGAAVLAQGAADSEEEVVIVEGAAPLAVEVLEDTSELVLGQLELEVVDCLQEGVEVEGAGVVVVEDLGYVFRRG